MEWKRRIYFAGSVSGGRANAPAYQQIHEKLQEYGDVLPQEVADPELSSDGEPLLGLSIYEREMQRLKSADVVVADITVPSFGVGFLTAMAVSDGKPTLALYRPERPLSSMASGCEQITCRSYESLQELSEALQDFFMRV